MTDFIYSRPDRCSACDAELQPWLSRVVDRVYGVGGNWNLSRCQNADCAAGYLDASLTDEQLGSFYATYGTHAEPAIEARGAKRLFRQVVEWIWHRQLGYPKPATPSSAAFLASLLGIIPFIRHMALYRIFWLPRLTKGKLVEIGFGNAHSLLQLRDLGWDVRGVEFDTVCIENARSLGLVVDKGDFLSQPYADDSLDAVVGSHVIEHVPDPGDLIAAIHRKLVDGGRMVLVTPNGKSIGSRIFGPDWRGLEVPRHLTIQTPGSLLRYAKKAGFRNIRLFGTPLGGGIIQQSVQIRLGKPVGNSGRAAQMFWAAVASAIHLIRPKASDEIVLVCEK